ncbi:MAG: HypC/HybG/HupF family hydrogenase formation chaperone [Gemmatimonadota bacterium]|nr:HypC/HybG/HupF family hydrogenase formation chaperone [Gemmatimonadota bacterium]
MSDSLSIPRCDAPDGQCHVCGDVAVAGRVIAIDSVGRTATVSMGNEQATVALDLVDAEVGDDLLVHLGFAIERLERV